MNIEELRDFCLSQKAVTEGFPFDETTLVFKVGGKIFLITDLEEPFSVSLKNTPEKVVRLLELYPAVKPGYHLNKRHWITVTVDDSLPSGTLHQLILESYQIVCQGLSAKARLLLGL